MRNLIRFGERPSTVPNQFIANLYETEVEGAVAIPPARDSYQPGEKVQMREGPFDGLIATVLSANDCERIMVMMDLLNQSVRVSVSIKEVVPDKAASALFVRPDATRNLRLSVPAYFSKAAE